MGEYRTVETSAEVWAVIRARHPELRMFTSYGFAQADYPLMEAETTWDIELSRPGFRRNEVHQYWLCCPVNGGE